MMKKRMLSDYSTKIELLELSKRLHFYELLAHNLTIVIRGVWSDEQMPDAAKVERLKVINEIMHRVTGKTWSVRLGAWQYPDDIMICILEDYIAQVPDIGDGLEWAVQVSYEAVTKSADGSDEALEEK